MEKQEPELGLLEVEFHALPSRNFLVERELVIIEDELR